ncbi:MAG: hypothetical protein LC776_18040 [Acidobacteria bacterium]|nr:hypothetical protein [Acidobacteriota bacterium]
MSESQLIRRTSKAKTKPFTFDQIQLEHRGRRYINEFGISEADAAANRCATKEHLPTKVRL